VEKPEKIKILYVDDEMNNLVGFRASFRMDYHIFIAANTQEATEHLEKNSDISIIFCDHRMPDKTGVQFFEEIRSRFPYPIRILLTGYADIESVIDAINLGNVFRYIKKPWTNTDILSAITEANKFYITNSMLAIKMQELQKAYDELDKFSYSVTHDMRGPLLSILGVVEVAQLTDDVDEIKEMLNMLQESVKTMDNYIQSIHDYYSLKRGQLHIELINFNEIATEQENTFRVMGEMNQVKLSVKVKQDEPFRCDKMSLKIILNNLLSNAFKYQKKNNPDKFVELDISVASGVATMHIKDNGIGIPENHIGEVYNMFFRASSEEVGSGFGLYNVKDALTKLNGEIKVNSLIDLGTTFTVTIRSK
jgi:signal transduction histidine kinase